MKNLLILSGAIFAGMLVFSPANAGVSTVAAVKLNASAGVPVVTKAHYKRRQYKRRIRRHQRRHHHRYNMYRPYYSPYYTPHYYDRRYYGHRRRGLNLYFGF